MGAIGRFAVALGAFHQLFAADPAKFIGAAYTNLDKKILHRNSKTPGYQRMRLEGTKAKFSRTLLKNAENHGDDDAYYGAVQTYLNQSLKSKIQKSNRIKLNTTKKSLAEKIGVQRTSLSRELAKMRDDGLILFDTDSITLLK